MTIKSVRVSALVEDFGIYPRHAVDSSHVGRLEEALRAGEKLPPPTVEAKSMRIVDGFHRARAYTRVLGPDASIEVDVRTFADSAALVLAAVEANTRHGKTLDQVDRVRCAVLLKDAGVDPQQMALVLRIRPTSVDKLLVRVTPVASGSDGTIPGTNMLALKQSAAHMVGQTLTKEQAAVHAMLPGTSLTLLARQLTNALRSGFVDVHNQRLHEALTELAAELEVYMHKPAPVAP